MSKPSRTRRSTFSVSARLTLAATAAAILAALAVARALEPATQGFGTHEQLGLAPCWIQTQFGISCPTCGMTTSWAHAGRGRLGQAAASSAGGLLLWGLAMLAAPWLLAAAAIGRWPLAVSPARPLLWVGTVVLAVVLLDWLRRLASL